MYRIYSFWKSRLFESKLTLFKQLYCGDLGLIFDKVYIYLRNFLRQNFFELVPTAEKSAELTVRQLSHYPCTNEADNIWIEMIDGARSRWG